MGSAQFDREEDHWPRRWAEAYVDFAAGEKRSWLRDDGPPALPGRRLGRARRRPRRRARQLGAALPHHLGHRPGRRRAVRAPGPRARRRPAGSRSRFRHRVDELVVEGGAVVGVRGRGPRARRRRARPARAAATRSATSSYARQAVIVTSGGIGGNHDLVRQGLAGAARRRRRRRMVAGVPAHVDGRMLGITEAAGARVINPDRMWHYVEGLRNWDPIWDNHGIRILPGPSSLWLDATGKRLPAPYFPGFDTLGTLAPPAHDRLRLLVVRAHPEDHREGVRALGLRAEPRPHRQGHQAAAVAGEGRARRARSRRSSSTARTSSSPTP